MKPEKNLTLHKCSKQLGIQDTMLWSNDSDLLLIVQIKIIYGPDVIIMYWTKPRTEFTKKVKASNFNNNIGYKIILGFAKHNLWYSAFQGPVDLPFSSLVALAAKKISCCLEDCNGSTHPSKANETLHLCQIIEEWQRG